MRRLTLSFDNGPFPDVTPRVLDALAERDLRATFFVCGKDAKAPEQRAILERARAEGHRIGNHTLTHSVELGRTDGAGAAQREIGAAQEALGTLADAALLFRPYGGGGRLGPHLLSPEAVRFLCTGGYTCVLWNCVPRDWEDPAGWPARARREIDERDWTLVVLHDVPTGAMRQLPRFLDDALAAGVEIVAELPPDCVPIRRGAVVRELAPFVSGPLPSV